MAAVLRLLTVKDVDLLLFVKIEQHAWDGCRDDRFLNSFNFESCARGGMVALRCSSVDIPLFPVLFFHSPRPSTRNPKR